MNKKLIPSASNRRIGQALHDYQMLADGDYVLLAVSGGVDSLALCHILRLWQQKAPITFRLTALHLDMGFNNSSAILVEKQLQNTALPFQIISTDLGPQALAQAKGHDICFHCARNRRTKLFSLAQELGCNKLALGHHKDDIIETFFLNLFYGGNISTMLPSQPLFDGRLTIIRPLSYLDKQDITVLAERFKITAGANPCPQAGHSKRSAIRRTLARLYKEEPGLQQNIFASLAKVKPEYLPRIVRN